MGTPKHQVRNFYVVGGGCFGTQYVNWLLRSERLGWLSFEKIYVVDHDINCKLADTIIDTRVQLVVQDWLSYFPKLLANNYLDLKGLNDHWVPSPLSPHLVYLSFIHAAKALGAIKNLPTHKIKLAPLPAGVPTLFEIPNHDLAVSHAQWKCPVNCIEPAKCPAIRDQRTWEMRESIKAYRDQVKLDRLYYVQCQHLCHAVGTITLHQIYTAFQNFISDLAGASIKTFGVATISSCHGIISAASLD